MDREEIEQLVISSQKGESDAFAKLYDIFVNPIYRYMYYRIGKHDAEDLTELVFLKTWENIQKYYRGKHSFSSWLFRIAHNVVIDYYRSKRTEEELSEDTEDSRAQESTMNNAKRHFNEELLGEGMAQLKDHYRQILILKYVNDFSNEEIASIMGRSQAALRILQFRALKSLKNILERKGISASDV